MVDILLTTYNGDKYLKELLDSLINQTYNDIRILIRDDGSTDNTPSILNDYLKKYKQITLINDNDGNIGSTRSFLKLLDKSTAEYIAFCDQDDIWDKDKIQICVEELSKHTKPTIVYSNLELIDKSGKVFNNSYYKYMKRNPEKNDFRTILKYRGLIPGCSMVFNKKLKDLMVYSDANNIDYPDLYLSYIAACLGELVYIEKPLIQYRQTGNNQVGAVNVSISAIVKKTIKHPFNTTRIYLAGLKRHLTYFKNNKSIKEFYNNYKDRIDRNYKDYLSKKLS